MTKIGDEDPNDVERLAADADVLKSAWEETLDDMTAMAEAREEQGWSVLYVPAGDVAPENREVGETDRFGLTFVIPGNYAEEFEDAFRRGTYPKYEVYRKEVQGRVFMVVEYLDPEIEQVILVAGAYEMRNAPNMVGDAEEAGEFFTHHQKLDKTHLGTFRHDSHEKFVPHADRIEDWTRKPLREEMEEGDEDDAGADGDA